MKNKYFIAFIIAVLMLISVGCSKEEAEEDMIQPITMEPMEETDQGEAGAETENNPVNEAFEETSGTLTEEEKLLNERMEYYRKSAYYPEIIDYWENVREVRDVSNRIEPLYESDIRYLTKEDLALDPPVVIHLAKNEIYARHGYIFKNQDLYNYFMGCIWYTPTTAPENFSDEVFNECEKENLKLLDELDTM